MRKILAAPLMFAALPLALAAAAPAAAEVAHIGASASPIATAVSVSADHDMLYVSGLTPPPLNPDAPAGAPREYGDTKTQTIGVMKRIESVLKEQGLGMGDVVMMRVYLVGDPAKDGKMDFAGMMEGYKMFFGTPEQPNKPARVTVQVASLVGPGQMVEIEVQAAKPKM
ncbi:RidA family protein [Phenylobacterium sp.]|uniref:RidA family protein n=1 Tax=Phenylobacterium sp. TaxID=1871053 RepID=UPI0035AEAD4D